MVTWYKNNKKEVFRKLETSVEGLSNDEAKKRLESYGLNEISSGKKRSFFLLFLSQFKSPLIYILLITAFITYLLKHNIDTWVILGVVFFNALIGLIQEKKAENAMEALKKLISDKAKVLRERQFINIPAINVVPGDIINIEAGDRIPADLRIIESNNLKVDEAILTGESIPSEKFSRVLKENLSVADQDNMLFMGTLVVSGKGLGVTVATGRDTEFGKIAEIVSETKKVETPLQKKLTQLSRQLVVAIFFVCFLIFLIGILQGTDLLQIFLVAVSAAVSAIPEGLPAVITITLAIGVFQMAKRKAIIRKLVAVETLGSVSLLASDKTGTLTKNQMTVVKLYFGGEVIEVSGDGYEPKGEFYYNKRELKEKEEESLFPLIEAGVLCNNSKVYRSKKGEWVVDGDPTEGAIVVLGQKLKIKKTNLGKIFSRLDEKPFESKNNYMATLHKDLGREGNVIFAKGSLEKILEMSSFCYLNGHKVSLSIAQKKKIIEENAKFSAEALRVIAVAKKELKDGGKNIKKNELSKLTFLGFLGMYDPPRPEAKEAVKQCKRSGIRVLMITGDHSITAKAIARQIGIIKRDDEKVVSGEELSKMSPKQFKDTLARISVYARISPNMKFKITETLQDDGWIVGVTGDGVNDAPALKKADIGIAMGASGTDVSREAADLVLMDDNFATIVAAIEEGRTIFNNIRRVVFYLISTGIGEVFTILVAMILGMPLPLIPVQILWINLLTDGTADIALAMEPKHKGIMSFPPRSVKERIFNKVTTQRAFLAGGLMMICSIILYYFELQAGSSIERARTVVFITLVMFQIFNVPNSRSMSKSIFKMNFWSNWYTILSMSVSFVLALFTLYVPFMRNLFRTTVLGMMDWLKIILVSLTIIIVVEIDKMIKRKSKKSVSV